MIDTFLSSALNDSRVSHDEFINIITEKNIYENIKENIKDTADLSPLSCKILLMFETLIKDEKRNLLFSM